MKTASKGAGATLAAGIALAVTMAKPAEGFVPYVYKDPVGVLTYCYGETQNAKSLMGRNFAEKECADLITRRMGHYAQGNEACIPDYDKLHVFVQAAFNDFSYNLGNGAFCASTAAKHLRAGRIKDACFEIVKFNKARVKGVLTVMKGLTTRRILEQMYCLKGAK